VIQTIKKNMLVLGYPKEDFFELPEKFDTENSQEILIAIGWLIYTHNIIEMFILKSNLFHEEEYFKSNIRVIFKQV
jgi:hypothetical protein